MLEHDFLPNFTPNPHLDFGEFVPKDLDPAKHVITNYPNKLPYGLEDFTVDLDFDRRQKENDKEHFHPMSLKETSFLKGMNKHIFTKRWVWVVMFI